MARLHLVNEAPDTAELQRLVERAKAGDQAAWSVLYRRLYPKLLSYARRRLDPEAASDAVGEAMARAVAGIERFVWQRGGFDAWVISILRHVVLDMQRASSRRRTTQLVELPDVGDAPHDRLLADEEAAALRRAFAQLEPSDRELLELRVVAGLSSDDTATVLGKRAGAVRMAQSRALGRLRTLLEAS